MPQSVQHLPAGKVHEDFTAWAVSEGRCVIKQLKVAAIEHAGIGIVATEDIKVRLPILHISVLPPLLTLLAYFNGPSLLCSTPGRKEVHTVSLPFPSPYTRLTPDRIAAGVARLLLCVDPLLSSHIRRVSDIPS